MSRRLQKILPWPGNSSALDYKEDPYGGDIPWWRPSIRLEVQGPLGPDTSASRAVGAARGRGRFRLYSVGSSNPIGRLAVATAHWGSYQARLLQSFLNSLRR